jgi:outer membrane murein-binding lipoprotein Lpp
MNLSNSIRRLTELGLFIWAHPLYLFIIAGVIALLFLLGGIHSCREKRQEEKISNIRENITTGKAEANSLTNQKENIKQEVKNAENNSNQALNNYNSVLRRDSNQYRGTDAGRRFCEKFPDDSSCR